jgi:hypothetical protein
MNVPDLALGNECETSSRRALYQPIVEAEPEFNDLENAQQSTTSAPDPCPCQCAHIILTDL